MTPVKGWGALAEDGLTATQRVAEVRMPVDAGGNTRRRLSPSWLLVSPALLVFVVFFIGPVLLLTTNSVTLTEGSDVFGALSFEHYIRFFTDAYYLDVLWRSLRVASVVTVATLVLTFPVAWFIATSGGKGLRLILLSMLAPLLSGGVVVSVGWLSLLVTNGPVDQLLSLVPWLDGNFSLFHTQTAIMIGLIHFLSPFMLISLMSSIEGLPWNAIRASQSLGATPVATFRYVVFPLAASGISAGITIVFALSMSAFAVPYFLGGRQQLLISTLSYQQTARLSNYSFGAALAIVLVSISLAAAISAGRVAKRLNPETSLREGEVV